MKLSEVKSALTTMQNVVFKLENGSIVPAHFHITEVGQIDRNFIDCGGTIRKDQKVNFQLWIADDYDHQLKAEKLLNIIELSERLLGIKDGEVEVEYQRDTIGKFNLALDKETNVFILENTMTACLAEEACGFPIEKKKVSLSSLKSESCCTPQTDCCSDEK
ncbi:MAG: DUF6428 family protein [Flavobacteriaceae bacterium]|jgi:hypothetical protein|nr:DUF6428 family protein [Flavobacteriaceae bacterium]